MGLLIVAAAEGRKRPFGAPSVRGGRIALRPPGCLRSRSPVVVDRVGEI